ncbi:MAG TPA: pol polyprotein, partial [Candidatus Nitrosocosmicus sp.]|nr:pol polyprotein [Candidatus Nitrosocosmicus sp.]
MLRNHTTNNILRVEKSKESHKSAITLVKDIVAKEIIMQTSLELVNNGKSERIESDITQVKSNEDTNEFLPSNSNKHTTNVSETVPNKPKEISHKSLDGSGSRNSNVLDLNQLPNNTDKIHNDTNTSFDRNHGNVLNENIDDMNNSDFVVIDLGDPLITNSSDSNAMSNIAANDSHFSHNKISNVENDLFVEIFLPPIPVSISPKIFGRKVNINVEKFVSHVLSFLNERNSSIHDQNKETPVLDYSLLNGHKIVYSRKPQQRRRLMSMPCATDVIQCADDLTIVDNRLFKCNWPDDFDFVDPFVENTEMKRKLISSDFSNLFVETLCKRFRFSPTDELLTDEFMKLNICKILETLAFGSPDFSKIFENYLQISAVTSPMKTQKVIFSTVRLSTSLSENSASPVFTPHGAESLLGSGASTRFFQTGSTQSSASKHFKKALNFQDEVIEVPRGSNDSLRNTNILSETYIVDTFTIFDSVKSKFTVNVSPRNEDDIQMDEIQHDVNDGKSSECMDSSMVSDDEVGISKVTTKKSRQSSSSSSSSLDSEIKKAKKKAKKAKRKIKKLSKAKTRKSKKGCPFKDKFENAKQNVSFIYANNEFDSFNFEYDSFNGIEFNGKNESFLGDYGYAFFEPLLCSSPKLDTSFVEVGPSKRTKNAIKHFVQRQNIYSTPDNIYHNAFYDESFIHESVNDTKSPEKLNVIHPIHTDISSFYDSDFSPHDTLDIVKNYVPTIASNDNHTTSKDYTYSTSSHIMINMIRTGVHTQRDDASSSTKDASILLDRQLARDTRRDMKKRKRVSINVPPIPDKTHSVVNDSQNSIFANNHEAVDFMNKLQAIQKLQNTAIVPQPHVSTQPNSAFAFLTNPVPNATPKNTVVPSTTLRHKSHRSERSKKSNHSKHKKSHRKKRDSSPDSSDSSSSPESSSSSSDSDSSSDNEDNRATVDSNLASRTIVNNILNPPSIAEATAQAVNLMASNLAEISKMNKQTQYTTALRNIPTISGRESYYDIKRFFKTVDDFTAEWPEKDIIDLLKKRTRSRAKKIFDEYRKKYGHNYKKISKKMLEKLAMTDTHKSDCRFALSRGLNRQPHETLQHFGNRVYEVTKGAHPELKNVDELAADHFLLFIKNARLASQLQTARSKKESFEDLLLRAVEAENLWESYKDLYSTRRETKPNFTSERTAFHDIQAGGEQRRNKLFDRDHHSSRHFPRSLGSQNPQNFHNNFRQQQNSNHYNQHNNQNYQNNQSQQNYQQNSKPPIICFTCNEPGHISTSCPKKQQAQSNNQNSSYGSNKFQNLKLTGGNAPINHKPKINHVSADIFDPPTPSTSRVKVPSKKDHQSSKLNNSSGAKEADEFGDDLLFANITIKKKDDNSKLVPCMKTSTTNSEPESEVEKFFKSVHKKFKEEVKIEDPLDKGEFLSAIGLNSMLLGSILGIEVKALMDTGAQASIISANFIYQLIMAKKATLESLCFCSSSPVSIYSASGHSLKEFGTVVVPFERRNGRIAHLKLIIADLPDKTQVMLGPAALKQLGIALFDKYTQETMDFRNLRVNKTSVKSVYVNDEQVLEPQSYSIIECRVHDIWNNTIGLVSGLEDQLKEWNCAVESTLVKPELGIFRLKLLNPNPFMIVFPKSTIIGDIDAVEEIIPTSVNNANNCSIPIRTKRKSKSKKNKRRYKRVIFAPTLESISEENEIEEEPINWSSGDESYHDISAESMNSSSSNSDSDNVEIVSPTSIHTDDNVIYDHPNVEPSDTFNRIEFTFINKHGRKSKRIFNVDYELKPDENEIDFDRWNTVKSKLDKNMTVEDEIIKSKLYEILHTYRYQFAATDAELTQTDLIEHCIDTCDHPPYKAPWRPVPFKLQEKVSNFVNEFLNQGIIIPSTSPWNSAIVLVKKKDGTLRFCIDYRGVNSLTKKDSYPLPNIDAVLTSLGGKKVFSSIDLASGYWQIKMSKDSQEKTAFSAAGKLWQWVVMPFGLTTAPATFQRLMNNILGDLTFVIVYLDDILICSRNWQEHLEHLSIVFERLKSAGLRMKPSKCSFGVQELIFLGHIVTPEGLRMDGDKMKAIDAIAPPNTKKHLQRFLGMTSYYRKFIYLYGPTAAPLYDLLTLDDKNFKMSESGLIAFKKLKELMRNDVLLRFPNFEGAETDCPFTIMTDASNDGMGAILSQKDPDSKMLRPLYFASRRTSKTEKNKKFATELEAAAIFFACNKFSHFITGFKTIVLTDHIALVSMYRSLKPVNNAYVDKWFTALRARFDLKLEYTKGRSNTVADCLSRALVERTENDKSDSENEDEEVPILKIGIKSISISNHKRTRLNLFKEKLLKNRPFSAVINSNTNEHLN